MQAIQGQWWHAITSLFYSNSSVLAGSSKIIKANNMLLIKQYTERGFWRVCVWVCVGVQARRACQHLLRTWLRGAP